ncbi:hypothetical protein QUF61_05545 [Candidatus Venteria ishoeyi]|uniref:hypothetical protein n=1 Tax=Candidatus Venteria ishoeyi TaxID=1899563 RepID=UPI0025A50CB7|nr:hypothetical protein [Candidatus Venteria ishoeyi]MDM8545936.1 hypothetical protein [Candidatus Venteria ishoeyi]
MDYSAILNALNNASLFELHRLSQAIYRQLEDPERINRVKRALSPGDEITYFESEENRLIAAVIVKLKRTRALVKNKHDGKLWNIPFHSINLEQQPVDLNTSQKLDRNSLKVGDQACFKDKNGVELFGEVVKLNPKTAGVLVGTTKWRVAYSYLSLIIDGELAPDKQLLEGQVLSREISRD